MSNIIELKKGDHVSNEDIKGFRFVISAIDNKHGNEALHHVLINNGYVVGSNGYIINIYEPGGLYKNGLYSVMKNTKSNIVLAKSEIAAEYPNWENCFPYEHKNFKKQILCPGSSIYFNYATVIRMMDSCLTINFNYFSTLPSDIEIDFYYYDINSPVCFMGEGYLAGIMPIKG